MALSPAPAVAAALLTASVVAGVALTPDPATVPVPRARGEVLAGPSVLPHDPGAGPSPSPPTGVGGGGGGSGVEAVAGWRWPLGGEPPPRVVRGFAPGPAPWSAGHRGVDLAATDGAAVIAPAAGVVRFAGPVAARPVVVVEHAGGVRTTYEPVRAEVDVGDVVGTGQVVGRLGTMGSHCAPAVCLHWGARRGEAYLDPLSFLADRRPIVLLPWSASPITRLPR